MFKFLRSSKGFSLVELIVVIVILGVLVGIAVPNLLGYIGKSRITADIANAEVLIRTATTVYADLASKTAAFDLAKVQADTLKVLNMSTLPVSKVTGETMFLSVKGGALPTDLTVAPEFLVLDKDSSGSQIAPMTTADSTSSTYKWPRNK